jgi:hypothetical protein
VGPAGLVILVEEEGQVGAEALVADLNGEQMGMVPGLCPRVQCSSPHSHRKSQVASLTGKQTRSCNSSPPVLVSNAAGSCTADVLHP